MQELELQINSIAGSIPPSIGNLTNLKDLRLYGNYLSGRIPETIGNLKSLGMCYYLIFIPCHDVICLMYNM